MPADQLFDFLENLFKKKVPVTPNTPFKDQYMAVKFLSLYPGTFMEAVEANRFSTKIPGWATNCFLYATVRKQRAPRFHYPKNEDKAKQWPKEAIKKVSGKFCCSDFHASQILDIMEKQNPKVLDVLGVKK
jgi:hypothetical protein